MFGAVLLLYSFVAIVSLTLLLLYRENSAVQVAGQEFQLGAVHAGSAVQSRIDTAFIGHSAKAQSALGFRLSSLRPVFSHAATLTVLTLVVASVVFFLMPRFNTRPLARNTGRAAACRRFFEDRNPRRAGGRGTRPRRCHPHQVLERGRDSTVHFSRRSIISRHRRHAL